jgi:hypothetical protein
MANRDDVTRGVAECDACGAVYAAREWPDGAVKTIGTDTCSCGASEFSLVENVGEDVPASDTDGTKPE